MTGSGFKRFGGLLAVPLALLGAIVMLMIGLVACTNLTTSGSEVVTSTDTLPSTTSGATATTELVSTTSVPTPTTTAAAVSAESIAYAQSIGGTSHMGEELYFVIGASVATEAEAKALLEPAKAVGDMQSSFIVQLSDNFDGMSPGYWVIFEAYDGYPSEDDLFFCRRPFPDAYVVRATVMTNDPIPVRPGG